MAVDVCSDIPSLVSSPRISFSHYLNQTNNGPTEPSLLDPSFDFDFDLWIGKSLTKFSSADELFSNGKILPVEIKKQVTPAEEIQRCEATTVCENANERNQKKQLKEFLCGEFDAENTKPLPKSFWQFSRSSSLNLESSRSKSIIRSLQFLSRSNSAGSALTPKPKIVSKDNQKQNLSKQPTVAINPPPSSYSQGYCYPYSSSRRPPLRKNFRSYSNGGVRISPVLNIAHNCIDKGTVTSLFGFGSLFCNGKAKKKKK